MEKEKKVKYGHVGRPTNEEVNEHKNKIKNKKKKKVLIFLIAFIVFASGFVYFFGDSIGLSEIMGNIVAKKRIMTFVDEKNNTGVVVRCPSGYSLRYDKNNSKSASDWDFSCYKDRRRNPITKKPIIMKVPYYSQNDYRNTYSRCGGGNLNVKGCLPTVGAMVFSALLDKNLTPADMNSAAKNYGSICYGNSYTASFIDNYASNNGVKVYTKYYQNSASKNKKLRKEILNMLKIDTSNGKCVGVAALEKSASCVGNVKSDLCYSSVGHFIMFYSTGAITLDSKNVYVNDPARKNNGTKEISHEKYDLLDIIESSQYNKVRILCKK